MAGGSSAGGGSDGGGWRDSVRRAFARVSLANRASALGRLTDSFEFRVAFPSGVVAHEGARGIAGGLSNDTCPGLLLATVASAEAVFDGIHTSARNSRPVLEEHLGLCSFILRAATGGQHNVVEFLDLGRGQDAIGAPHAFQLTNHCCDIATRRDNCGSFAASREPRLPPHVAVNVFG